MWCRVAWWYMKIMSCHQLCNVNSLLCNWVTKQINTYYNVETEAWFLTQHTSITNKQYVNFSCTHLIWWAKWTVIRFPEAPRGCPKAMAPPHTLVLAGSSPSAFWTARNWGAKASLTWNEKKLKFNMLHCLHHFIVTACEWASGETKINTTKNYPLLSINSLRG